MKLREFLKQAIAVSFAVALLNGVQAGAGTLQLEWKQTESSLSLLSKDKEVWRFNYSKDMARPYFHPVALPGGQSMTWDNPPDHPWHHGLWFSWKFINGLNYWEEDEKGASEGRRSWKILELKKRQDFSAHIVLQVKYRPVGTSPVLTERREIEISAPDSDGRYYMDWKMTFTAGDEDVVLDRTPIIGEDDGVIWGGYAGLSWRWTKELTDMKIVGTSGVVKNEESFFNIEDAAIDFTGILKGKHLGVAILDHKGNIGYPTPYYFVVDPNPSFYYFSPAILYDEAYTLKARKSISLLYRVLIHPGQLDSESLKKELQKFWNRSGQQ